MIETTPNTRTRDAFRAAHAERSAAFTSIFRKVFGRSEPRSGIVASDPPERRRAGSTEPALTNFVGCR